MIRLLDGTYVASGDNASPTGADITTPLKVIPANGYSYTGTLIDVAASGYPSQYAILTTDGLWAWGSRGHLLPTGSTSSSQFQKITIPAQIIPSDVNVIDAGEEVMAMLMNNGEVYVVSSRSGSHNGGGTTTLSSNFTKVMLDATTPLTGVTDIQVSTNGIFAYNASTNKFYTWGIQTYLGDASARATRSFATEMVNPLPTGVKAKQIELSTDETTGTSYYVLGTDQKIYVLGANTEGQLGLGNNTAALSWGIVKNQAGTADLTGVLLRMDQP
ncbi:hypothetical protein GHT06_003737 [Daphnia sinensis]|uniref:Uncharacterized protein n=1 Tax=Daphnia sinensis TaxID=1820382 RepID=A0AAD5KTB1_9CRUS|nr:hypothetical protein GHT06_003737 [Daphnia sinensis]